MATLLICHYVWSNTRFSYVIPCRGIPCITSGQVVFLQKNPPSLIPHIFSWSILENGWNHNTTTSILYKCIPTYFVLLDAYVILTPYLPSLQTIIEFIFTFLALSDSNTIILRHVTFHEEKFPYSNIYKYKAYTYDFIINSYPSPCLIIFQNNDHDPTMPR